MKPASRRSGFALVIVLAILVLVVALTVGFLLRASTERTAAFGFQASAYSRHLADMAVNLVQGQINIAATQGSDVAWVSQPGMVRTFDTTGTLIQAYKLYSDKDMVDNKVVLNDPELSDWSAHPALWTDLNAPVTVDGAKNYPVVDPDLASTATSGSSAPGTIPGFQIDGSKAPVTPKQSAPMPVRWLYVLQDGRIVAPTSGSGARATVGEATKENPIVGRVAFWTDDDCCKVNVNTAGEGTYWDVPRAACLDDKDFARKQPVLREVQRYPGHPATTSLSAVLPPDPQLVTLDNLFKITPRLVNGGSKGGTIYDPTKITFDSDRLYNSVDELIFSTDVSGMQRVNNPALTKKQLEQVKFLLTAHSRAPETNLFNLPRIACWPIYKLGANGAADTTRTTAFDRLIELCASTGKFGTDTFHPYIFQREQAASPTNDISIQRNRELYEYLQYLTTSPIPGFGGSLLQKYPNTRDQILTEIFDYIRCANLYDDNLTAPSQFTPGKDNSGSNKIGHGWVAPAVRDKKDGSPITMGFGRSYSISEFGIGFICNADGNPFPGNTSNDRDNTDDKLPKNKVFAAGGIAAPSAPAPPLAPDEKVIQAILVMEFFCPMLGWTGVRPNFTVEIDRAGFSQFQITDSSGATQPLFPDFAVPGAQNFAIFNEDQVRQDEGSIWGGNPNWRYFGLYKGSPARGGLKADPSSADGNVRSLYPFIGVPVKIKVPSSGLFEFSGGTVTVKIYAGNSPVGSNLIQTLTISLPHAFFPIPNLVVSPPIPATMASGDRTTTSEDWWTFSAGGNMPGHLGRLYFTRYYAALNGRNPLDSIAHNEVRNGVFFRYGFDTVRTVAPLHGDYRLVAGKREVGPQVFQRVDGYDNPSLANPAGTSTATLSNSYNPQLEHFNDLRGKYFSAVTYPGWAAPDIPVNASQTPEATGDVDTSIPRSTDGPYINKPDEGNTFGLPQKVPYFDAVSSHTDAGATFFSPNRIMPSPGMFGSLPTGLNPDPAADDVPWQTLLFRPQDSHPQSRKSRASESPDHLFLDLFWMPVVEPYAISDRFSTGGKINMNYQIMPFSSYLKRSTGLRALLKAEKVAAIPTTAGSIYKENYIEYNMPSIRLAIDNEQTLSQFETKFATGDVFKSASEICDIHIVPQNETPDSMENFWKNHILTGDNMRERIYTTLYPRLTTKSNTYTIHVRAQSLRKVRGTAAEQWDQWDEGQDKVTGEYRGSVSIERFIDANNPDIPDYAAKASSIPSQLTLDTFYRWRVIENRQFAP